MPKKDFVIEFKLMRGKVEELLFLYTYFLTNYVYADEHEALLCEHVKDMYIRLERMERNMMKTGTLGLNNSEALAFSQMWKMIDISCFPLSYVLTNDMMEKIDKRVKKPKAYA